MVSSRFEGFITYSAAFWFGEECFRDLYKKRRSNQLQQVTITIGCLGSWETRAKKEEERQGKA